MAWIRAIKKLDGKVSYWIHDKRDGRHISIFGGETREDAEKTKVRYEARLALEKEGYDDAHTVAQQQALEALWLRIYGKKGPR
jgi:hypothetical protein